jgi:hypothetical protein
MRWALKAGVFRTQALKNRVVLAVHGQHVGAVLLGLRSHEPTGAYEGLFVCEQYRLSARDCCPDGAQTCDPYNACDHFLGALALREGTKPMLPLKDLKAAKPRIRVFA